MSQANLKTTGDSKAERQQLERQRREQEHREREQRLQEHREYLHEQMLIRRDYHALTIFHKMIILILFLSLSLFVGFLVLSYFPPTKDFVHNLIQSAL